MKRLSLLGLLLAGCGGPRAVHHDIYPRHVVLTTIGPLSPLRRPVEQLARYRHGEVIDFTDLAQDRKHVLSALRRAAPAYVAVVVEPHRIDAAFQTALFELACAVDADPFPDFSWGYFPAVDRRFLEMLLHSLRKAEERSEEKLLDVLFADFGEDAALAESQVLEWADRLPLRVLGLAGGEVEVLARHREALHQTDLLLMAGEGSETGIRGLPPTEVDRMHLDGMAVLSAAARTGVVGALFEERGGRLRRRPVDAGDAFALRLLRRGSPAFVAPLHDSRPGFVGEEWTHMILTGATMGETLKHTYDLAVLSAGGAVPAFPPLADGAPPPAALTDASFLAAVRILHGDPLLRLYRRRSRAPLAVRPLGEDRASDGTRIVKRSYRVDSTECAPFFQDPFTGLQKIHLRIPVDRNTRTASATVERCHAGDRDVRATVAAQALEDWGGSRIFHVLLRGTELAQEGLELDVTLRLK